MAGIAAACHIAAVLLAMFGSAIMCGRAFVLGAMSLVAVGDGFAFMVCAMFAGVSRGSGSRLFGTMFGANRIFFGMVLGTMMRAIMFFYRLVFAVFDASFVFFTFVFGAMLNTVMFRRFVFSAVFRFGLNCWRRLFDFRRYRFAGCWGGRLSDHWFSISFLYRFFCFATG
jgi:hypothetical protein